MLEWFLYTPLGRLTNHTEKNKPMACKAGWETVVVSGLKFSRVTKTFSRPVPLLDGQRVVPPLGALARHPQVHGLEVADVHAGQRAHARQRRGTPGPSSNTPPKSTLARSRDMPCDLWMETAQASRSGIWMREATFFLLPSVHGELEAARASSLASGSVRRGRCGTCAANGGGAEQAVEEHVGPRRRRRGWSPRRAP